MHKITIEWDEFGAILTIDGKQAGFDSRRVSRFVLDILSANLPKAGGGHMSSLIERRGFVDLRHPTRW